jgi:hypothetical protein
MASLFEICQQVYDSVYPNASIQTSVKVDHLIVESKVRYAYEMWLQSKISAREDGGWEVPSVLLQDATIEVKDNEADISALNIFRSFEGDVWIQSIGGMDCECSYMKQSVNISKMLCDDEYLGNSKPYIIVGKKIKFPKGTHEKSLPIVYASNGEGIDGDIEVDDAIGALVSDYLWKRFTNRLPEDRTQNSNSNV